LDCNLRPITLADLEQIVAIEKKLFSVPWSMEMFEQELKHVSFALTLNDEIIGYVCGWRVLTEFEITNFGVNPDNQRNGYGSVMLEKILSRLNSDGVNVVYLEVREFNVAARVLYSKFGFEPVGIRKKYYVEPVEDAIIMRLKLA